MDDQNQGAASSMVCARITPQNQQNGRIIFIKHRAKKNKIC
jgi:hypothetical protein